MSNRALLTVGSLCASVAIVCFVLQSSDQMVEEQVLETALPNVASERTPEGSPLLKQVGSGPVAPDYSSTDGEPLEYAEEAPVQKKKEAPVHVQAAAAVTKLMGVKVDTSALEATRSQLKELQSALAKRNSKLQAARKESKRLKLIATAERSKIDALVGQLKDNANMMLDIGKKKSSKSTEECLTPPSLPHIEMQKHNKLKKFDFHYKNIEKTNKQEVTAKAALEKKRAKELKSKGESESKVKKSKENLEKAKELYSKQKTLHVEKEDKEHTSKHEQKEKKCAEGKIKEVAVKRTDEAEIKGLKERLTKKCNLGKEKKHKIYEKWNKHLKVEKEAKSSELQTKGLKEKSDKVATSKEASQKAAAEKKKKGNKAAASKKAAAAEKKKKHGVEKKHKEGFVKGKVKESNNKSESLSWKLLRRKPRTRNGRRTSQRLRLRRA